MKKQNNKSQNTTNQPYTQFRDNLLQKQPSQSDDKSVISIEMRSVVSHTSQSPSITIPPSENIRKTTRLKYIPQKDKQIIINQQIQQLNPLNKNLNNLNLQVSQQTNSVLQNSYDVWDLTYTLMSSKIPIGLTTVFFIIFVMIRYYTIACLIYIAIQRTNSQDTLWSLVIVWDRLLYMFLVIKISLQTPQTRTQIVLKSHWNSKQSQISQYFQIIDKKKLFISIIRGLIPAQLSFIYIRAQPRRRFQLYTAINYINASIQAVVYYPFFIIYCSILTVDNSFSINKYYPGATICLAIFAELIMIFVTIILIVKGVKRKYGKFLYWL